MAVCHMIQDKGNNGLKVNLCNKAIFGFCTNNLRDCTCAQCLKVIINDNLMKIDELEDDLMVANRTIAVLSEREEN